MKTWGGVQIAGALCIDSAITVALIIIVSVSTCSTTTEDGLRYWCTLQLSHYKTNTGVIRTKNLLNTLILHAVENGLVVTIVVAAHAFVFYTRNEKDLITVTLCVPLRFLQLCSN